MTIETKRRLSDFHLRADLNPCCEQAKLLSWPVHGVRVLSPSKFCKAKDKVAPVPKHRAIKVYNDLGW
jgi:hypothetical protein